MFSEWLVNAKCFICIITLNVSHNPMQHYCDFLFVDEGTEILIMGSGLPYYD